MFLYLGFCVSRTAKMSTVAGEASKSHTCSWRESAASGDDISYFGDEWEECRNCLQPPRNECLLEEAF
jgi:hypothetical protein